MIVALLSWWDESPSMLTRCVVPLARFADHLVAFDGAYSAVPGAELRPVSPGAQADAVVAAAESASLGLTLHRPSAPWLGEVEKRSAMFRAADLVCAPGDWVFVIDADEVVRDVPADVAAQLEATDREVATIEFQDGAGSSLVRRFFRWHPTLRVVGRHFTYVVEDRVLWGDSAEHEIEQPSHVSGFRVEHVRGERSSERTARQKAYYERRDRLGLETTARRLNGEGPVFAFDPREGSRHFAMVVSPAEFEAVMERGYANLDDQRAAVVKEDCDEASGFMRFYLDEPYRKPVPA